MEYNYSTSSPTWLSDEAEQDFCFGAKASTPQLYSAYPTPPNSASPNGSLGEEWMENSETLDNCLLFDTFNNVILPDTTFNPDDLLADFQDVGSISRSEISTPSKIQSSPESRIIIKLKKFKHPKTSSNSSQNKLHRNNQLKVTASPPFDSVPTSEQTLEEINQLVMQNQPEYQSPPYNSSDRLFYNGEDVPVDQNRLDSIDPVKEEHLRTNSWLDTEHKMDQLMLFQEMCQASKPDDDMFSKFPDSFFDSIVSDLIDSSPLDQSTGITLQDALTSGDDKLVEDILYMDTSINSFKDQDADNTNIDDVDSRKFIDSIEFVQVPCKPEMCSTKSSPNDSLFDSNLGPTLDLISPVESEVNFDISPMESDVTLDIESPMESDEALDVSSSATESDVTYSPSTDVDFSEFSPDLSDSNPMKRERKTRRTKLTRPKLSVESRHLRKKEQNKEAAVRYRNKKKGEDQELFELTKLASLERDKLKTEFANLRKEVSFMKKLLRDAYLK